MMTKIAFCTCEHAYQDQRYGSHKRVWNQGKEKSKGIYLWRCTVCAKVKEEGD